VNETGMSSFSVITIIIILNLWNCQRLEVELEMFALIYDMFLSNVLCISVEI